MAGLAFADMIAGSAYFAAGHSVSVSHSISHRSISQNDFSAAPGVGCALWTQPRQSDRLVLLHESTRLGLHFWLARYRTWLYGG